MGESPRGALIDGDTCLLARNKAAHHGLYAPFKGGPLVPEKRRGLVVQYEVKAHDGLTCSGAYLKLAAAGAVPDGDPASFSGDTPFVVMFGPDKCGRDNDRVHFILVTPDRPGVEHHMTRPPAVPADRMTHLYTLVVRPDDSFEVFVDGESARSGSLLGEDDFSPPVQPPREVDDPEDRRPDDWVTDPEMDDPDDARPDDWPADVPREVPDPEAERPADWDDESDGEWEAPTVPNPAYRGEWRPRRVPNPAYAGEWRPRRVPNPDFYEVTEPWRLGAVGGVGFELWCMDNNIEFDNVLVGAGEDEARAYGDATWRRKRHEEELRESTATSERVPMAKRLLKAAAESPAVLVGACVAAVLGAMLVLSFACASDKDPEGNSDDEADDGGGSDGSGYESDMDLAEAAREAAAAAARAGSTIDQRTAERLASASAPRVDGDDLDDLAAELGDGDDDDNNNDGGGGGGGGDGVRQRRR